MSIPGPYSREEQLRVKFLKLAVILFGIVAGYSVIEAVL